jgi:hypothetical protein
MIRILKSTILFAAGFAAAALLFWGNSAVPRAEASGCVTQNATFQSKNGSIGDNTIQVTYQPPLCLQQRNYIIVDVNRKDNHAFRVNYLKRPTLPHPGG